MPPMMAGAGCRRRARVLEAAGGRGLAHGSRRITMLSAVSAISTVSADQQPVGQVHEQIDDYVDYREQQDDALDDGVVAPDDGIDGQAADARHGKHGLGDHDAPDQQRDADADDGDDRHGRVLECVLEQHCVGQRPWRGRCARSPVTAHRAWSRA